MIDQAGSSEASAGQVEDPVARLAARMEVRFNDLAMLRLALTHRSVLPEWAAAGLSGPLIQSNERLEFLGDAYLGAITAEWLYDRFPNEAEGSLTARRVALVRTETLVRWARSLHLPSYLYLGQGERITESPRDRILAGAFEALVGAVAVDRGWRETRRFVLRFLRSEPAGDALAGMASEANPKGRLQEVVQGRLGTAPVYETVAIEGPDHDRRFTVAMSIAGETWGTGSGASKRQAQQAAALEALAHVAEMQHAGDWTRLKRRLGTMRLVQHEGETGE